MPDKLERVREGRCGVVYVAEQPQPVRRCVALIVIHLGIDTQPIIARYGAAARLHLAVRWLFLGYD